MNTNRISHIGILVNDADSAVQHWTSSFGLHLIEDQRIEVEGMRSVFLSVGGTWNEFVIEIMEPLRKDDESHFLVKRLRNHGEGFYHLCLAVDDVKTSGNELADAGLSVMMRDPIDENAGPRWLVHPRDANGVLVEAIEDQ
jgi:methylmalonyl-CoA/ethylmalonyl-CoA epimerase